MRRMRLIVGFIHALIYFVGATTASAHVCPSGNYLPILQTQDAKRAIVIFGERNNTRGAGFLIDSDLGLFLTAHHLLGDASVYEAYGLPANSGEPELIQFRRLDDPNQHLLAQYDVALLQVIGNNEFTDARPFLVPGRLLSRQIGKSRELKRFSIRSGELNPSRISNVPLSFADRLRFTSDEAPACDINDCFRFAPRGLPSDSGGPVFDEFGVVHGLLSGNGSGQFALSSPVFHIVPDLIEIYLAKLTQLEAENVHGFARIDRHHRAHPPNPIALDRLLSAQTGPTLSNLAVLGFIETIDRGEAVARIDTDRDWKQFYETLVCGMYRREVHEYANVMKYDMGLVVSAEAPGVAAGRDSIQVAGSSTVLPYASIVAENFGETFPDFPTPIVESGGSSSGLREFCRGVGTEFIDIANASRAIRDSEVEECAANGVSEIQEIRIGYDGIVFATDINGPDFALEPIHMYQALAAQVVVDGELVDNPHTTWNEIDPSFPEWDIAAFIPGEKHGTREVFEENVLLVGCEAAGGLQARMDAGMDEDTAEENCYAVRKDGAAVDIDGDYTETLAHIDANKEGMGVFGLTFYENNTDKLKVATMSGVTPSTETIASGEYPVSRPLFFYVKQAHLGVVPGLREYVDFFISDAMTGPDSPLAQYGLVAAPEEERNAVRQSFSDGDTL